MSLDRPRTLNELFAVTNCELTLWKTQDGWQCSVRSVGAQGFAVFVDTDRSTSVEKALTDRIRLVGEQAAQKPVTATDAEEAAFIDSLHPDAKIAQPRCTLCDGAGDIHSLTGEWLGTCTVYPAGQPDDEDLIG